MIPKTIHYCWFGGRPLPRLAQSCIASWQRELPGYSIRRWDESNFDVNIVAYTAAAYRARKYAYVSDYARFWILYHYGGLYFDTDVELIGPMDDIVASGPFMGCERQPGAQASASALGVNPGLGLGAAPGLELYREIIENYASLPFVAAPGHTVVDYTTAILCRHGLKNSHRPQTVAGVRVYPKEYFCPIDFYSGEKSFTANTRSIHHYAATWLRKRDKIYMWLQRNYGEQTAANLRRLINRLRFRKL